LGYLLKESAPEDLVQAIQQIHRGEPSLHPTIARKVLQEITHPADRPPTPDPLTRREAEVLLLVAQGLSNQDIARKLHISDPTVRSHVSNIMSKLHLATRIQAAAPKAVFLFI
jgi:NarL family two-component system response regulator LiaR